VMAAIWMLASAACGENKAERQPEETPEAEQTAASTSLGYRQTILYYATDDGFMVPVMKMIPWEEGIGKAALRCLEDTDENRAEAARMGLVTPIPEGTVYSLRINDAAAATVDLCGLGDLGSAEKEQAMIVAIVNTLTEFPTIDTVSFTVDGKSVSELPNGTKLKGEFARFRLNAEGETETAAADGDSAMTLYFPNLAATLNIPVVRYGNGGNNFESAVSELIEGPEDGALRCCFPEGTALLYADLFDGSATVNLSAEFLGAQYTEGLAEAAYNTLFLTANAIEPIYELNILVEGKPYEFVSEVSAPLYANEFYAS